MSSILKALKKVEKEKGAFQGGGSPVSREILSEISRPPRKSGSRGRLLLIFLVLLGGGVLGGVFLMRDTEVPSVQTVQTVADIAPVSTPDVPVEPVTEPVTVAAGQLEPLPEPVAETTAEMPVPPADAGPDPLKIAEEVVQTTRDATVALKATATSLRDTAHALKNKVIVSSQPAVSQPVPAAAKTAPLVVPGPRAVAASRAASGSSRVPVSVASRTPGWFLSQDENISVPELLVSEIHWRPVAKERLAVVNDLPVLEGVDIEGARVDRIFKDRIRFVFNGRYLEVKVSTAAAQ
ncbi:hypothetical protein [Trichloromonas sp.]|uniref:hypothetical protein n=1 Tax=Trichloromonas sp. TaxID=3069249 RepID=UPI003D81C3EC